MLKVGDKVMSKVYGEGVVKETSGLNGVKVLYEGYPEGLWYPDDEARNHLTLIEPETKETTSMDNPFIEAVTTKKLKGSACWYGPDYGACVTAEFINKNHTVDIDINDQSFSKKDLGALLKILQEVHDLMD